MYRILKMNKNMFMVAKALPVGGFVDTGFVG